MYVNVCVYLNENMSVYIYIYIYIDIQINWLPEVKNIDFSQL